MSLLLLLLCTSGLEALSIKYSPKEICSLKGSTVVLRCTYSLPDGDSFKSGFWHRNNSLESGETVLTSPRFVFMSSNPQCLLRMNNLSTSDSGRYEYQISTSRSERLRASERVTVLVTDVPRKDCWGVIYSSTSFCVLLGTTADISCSYGYPSDHKVNKTFWYREKKGEDPKDLHLETDYEGRVEYLSTEEHKNTLRIRDVRETDSGEYRFRFTTDKPGGNFSGKSVSISVTDLQVSVSSGTVTEGGSVTLICHTSCNLRSDTIFIWYKNSQLTRHRATNNTLHLNPVSSEDAGNYSCAVRGHEVHRSPEAVLDVRFAPQNTVVHIAPHGETEGDDSVTLTCQTVANPAVDSYTWYRKRGTQISLLGRGQSYIIANVSLETKGLYYCVAQNSVGEQNSTAVSVPIAGQSSAKEAAIGILIVGALLLVLGFLWLRRRKSTPPPKRDSITVSQQADPSLVHDNVAAEAGNDVQYASIQFKSSKGTQVDPYITARHPHTQTTLEDVQYASVNCSRPKDTSQDEEAPVIYSTVNKLPGT